MKLHNFIFSIEDYGKTHRQIKLLGIKIKFPKFRYIRKKKENPYYEYKKNNLDIRTIPKATGQIRDIQLANLALLKELDYVCKQANLQYWLDYGTLLGAVRHKGYIPWDDDIDVSMLRDDYDKIIDAFEKYSRDKNIYAKFEIAETTAYRVAIKIRHKRCKHLFVDVFPNDLYGDHVSTKQQEQITKELKKQWEYLQKELTSDTPVKIAQEKFDKVIKNNLKNKCSNSDILMGMDFYHSRKYWLYDNEIFFPLVDIEFEGYSFPAVNQPVVYLERVYGDYMAYPEKIGFGHNSYVQLSNEDNEVIKSLINDLENM